jgi:glycosyltransferase involved in cell wall biosynthesis
MYKMKRLAIVTTHPIQYYAPVFKLLAQQIDLMVFYTWGETSLTKHDPGFGKTITWDIDLLSGYEYKWLQNTSTDPGSHHFNGIINPNIITEIEAWQPDTLLVYGWAYKSHLTVLRHFKNKIPILFRGDSTLLDERPGLKNILRAIYLRWIYKHIDHTLYTGTNNKAYFKKYGLTDDQLVFAPHAVDNERFEIVNVTAVSDLKKKLNISDKDIVVLFAGKFEEKKDPALLLRSFMHLNVPDTHLFFVGDGDLAPILKQQASKYSNIHFIDFQNQANMPAIYQACDIFCLPSKGPGETWGLAINEAMACGKVVLVSDKVGCAIDLAKPAINGSVHIADSEADLSDKLLKLINKGKEQLAFMGQSSKQIIKNWNFTVQAANIINYKDGTNR